MSAKSPTPFSGTSSTNYGSEDDAVGSPKEELDALFSWTPPCLADGRKDSVLAGSNLMLSPLSFYDKHIDPSRSLKHIISNPTIQNTLCSSVEDALAFFEANGIDFPAVNGENSLFESAESRKRTELYSESSALLAEDVQEQYCATVGASCVPVASGLFLASSFPHWFCLLLLQNTGERVPNYAPGSSIEDLRVGLYINFLSPREGSDTPQREGERRLRGQLAGTAMETALNRVKHRFQHLVTFKMLPPFPEADALLRNMSTLCDEDSFDWKNCQTSGFPGPPAQELPLSVDSSKNPFLATTPKPSRAPSPVQRRGGGKQQKPIRKASQSSKPESLKLHVIPSPPKTKPLKTAQARRIQILQFIQRAWAESVDKDTTIIVFRSGSLERIAIRERKTQSLHLSDLYDLHATVKLSYTKVHVGLFMAAIKDAIQRAELLENVEEKLKIVPSKSKVVAPSRTTKLQQKVVAARGSFSGALTRARRKELNSFGERNLLLVNVCYGNFNSPAPASLFRTGKALRGYDGPEPASLPKQPRAYSETDYIIVVLRTKIGGGATGIAHSGLLKAQLSSNSSTEHRVVVKLAFDDAQRTRLRHEYSIYERLAKAGVDQVLQVWGMFENDAESVSALVLEHGGTSLRRLKSQQKMVDPKHSTAAFYAVLADINAAGVTHGDLRPENLLVDERGRATIIDFDLAVMKDDETPASSEAGHLRTMFEVYYNEKNG